MTMVCTHPQRRTTKFLLFALGLLTAFPVVCANHRTKKISSSPAFVFAPFEKIQKDFLALTRKATARHILLPKSSEAALALKQKIRYAAEERFIVDVFEDAARRYSLDTTTAEQGGLLGPPNAEPTPQGYCSCPELDEARFSAPLAQVAGPIESNYGYHLVLVTERTNCPKLDNGNTRVLRGENGSSTILAGPPEDESSTKNWIVFASGQILFWVTTFIAGGIVAELAADTATFLQNNNQLPGM